jgi:hypothetical protein
MKRLKSIAAICALFLTVLTTSNANAQDSVIGDTKNYDQGFRLGFGINGGIVFDLEPMPDYNMIYQNELQLL